MTLGFRSGCETELFHDQLGRFPGSRNCRCEQPDTIKLVRLNIETGPGCYAKDYAEFSSYIEFLDPACGGEFAAHCGRNSAAGLVTVWLWQHTGHDSRFRATRFLVGGCYAAPH